MALASQAPKSAEPPASALVATRPLRGMLSPRGHGGDAVDGVRQHPAGQPRARIAAVRRRRPRGRRRSRGRARPGSGRARPPARRRRRPRGARSGRARPAWRRRRGRGPRRRRSRGWTAASRNPSGAVYRGRAMRTLGATGLPVSPIGLGLAALGRPGYINLGHAGDVGDTDVAAMERHAHAVLDAAYDGRRALLRRGALLRARRGVPGLLARTPRPLARRRDGRLEVGLHLHRGLAVDVDEHEVKDLSVEHAAPPARRDARADRRAPRALPDPLGHDRERRPRRRRGARGARATARGGRPRSASPPPDRARPRRSSARSRSAASTPCRRPGTCTSARPPTRWPPRTRPAWA